jgi:ornithine cyclodeaminase/alanine dehydrogenase-like protein (mu-crystallin family)
MKWVSFFPDNATKNFPVSSALIVLNDPDSGLPVAIMEGMWITYVRTGACAALAARYAANPMPRRLGLIGCGGLGAWSLRCLAQVFPSIDEVFIASARPETRRAFCQTMSAQGPWALYPVDDIRLAVENMHIVVSSVPKLQQHPVRGEWLSPGTVMVPLDVTGAWDDDLYNSVERIVVDHRENLQKALGRYRPNLSADDARMISIDDIVLGKSRARATEEERVLAFMTGIGSVDMTIAWEIYRRARQAGLGTHFALT